jgi:hypothetical protein
LGLFGENGIKAMKATPLPKWEAFVRKEEEEEEKI